LDVPITLDEIKTAIRLLKNGKAVGCDGIMNEVLKFGGDIFQNCIWKLFNNVFESELFPEQWLKG
jgi:hypothetical protein